jgi:predicted GTPase
VLAPEGAPAPAGALRFELRPEPAEPIPTAARVALFTTGAEHCQGVEPVLVSTNLARREVLAADLERAAAVGCDLYLTELKAAAIDTVAVEARRRGAQVAFVRNRPVGLDGDLDAALVKLYEDAA